MLGTRIREYLKVTHRKQELLCEALHLSPATVSEILNDRRKLSAEEYFIVCDALGVPLDTFSESRPA